MRDWKIKFVMPVLERPEFAAAAAKIRHVALNECGAAVIEMALSCVVLFSMFLGVFQVCLASYTSHYVADAAREGARYAIVRGTNSCTNTPSLSNCGATTDQIKAYVKGLGYPGIAPANLTVNVSYLTGTGSISTGSLLTTWAACSSSPCNVPGNMVNVQVSYAFGFAVPFVPSNTLSVSSTSQMVVQQ